MSVSFRQDDRLHTENYRLRAPLEFDPSMAELGVADFNVQSAESHLKIQALLDERDGVIQKLTLSSTLNY